MSDVPPDPPRLRDNAGSELHADLVKMAMPPSLGATKKAELFARLMTALSPTPATSEPPAISSTAKLVASAAIPVAIALALLVPRGKSGSSPIPLPPEPPPHVATASEPQPIAKAASPEVPVDDLPSASVDSASTPRKVTRLRLGVADPPSSGDTLREELRLLDAARSSLNRAPANALRSANEHAHRFPVGQFAVERELVAVEALVRLGRMTEARARAAGLRRISSALDGRVSEILGERKAL